LRHLWMHLYQIFKGDRINLVGEQDSTII